MMTENSSKSAGKKLELIRQERVPARWFRQENESIENVQIGSSETNKPVESKDSPSTVRPDYSIKIVSSVGKYAFSSTYFPTNPSFPSPDESDVSTGIVVCELCPRSCRIAPGKTGACSARYNSSGKLFSRYYGRPVSVAIDPIEKKPLYHFLPGTTILSLGSYGCNLSCKFCQNWQISHFSPSNFQRTDILEPEEVVRLAIERHCPSVAFTYNEPTIWAEYVIDVAQLCRQSGIKTVVVTNGMIRGDARKELYSVVDAVNVDLKGFTERFYQSLTGGSLGDVQETLEYIAKETNVWLEITNLVIPGKNDSRDEIRRMSAWIVRKLGENIPIHFSAFFPTWRLKDVSPTSPQTLANAASIAKQEGVRFIYQGNVSEPEVQTTFCPQCGLPLIKRSSRYQIQISPSLKTTQGNSYLDTKAASVGSCDRCGEKIAGVFFKS